MILRILAFAGLVALPVHAQTCARRVDVVPLLASHGQAVRWMGTVRDEQMLEVFTAPSGGWVILATNPNGIACIIAAGHQWEGFAAPLPGMPG